MCILCKLKKQPPEPQACNFIKKDSLAQVLSCEFCKISRNTFFTKHLWATASETTEKCSVCTF